MAAAQDGDEDAFRQLSDADLDRARSSSVRLVLTAHPTEATRRTVLLAHIRIAEEHARFGVPEATRGLIAGAGSTMRLKRQIPYAFAMEMLLTGRILDAEEALRWGLVSHVVPTGAGLAKGHEIAGIIAAGGPLSVAASKASAVETGWLPEDQAGPIELRYAAMVTRSNDAKEGMRAFTEKRPPSFTGT